MADSFAAALAALQADLPRIPRTATGQAGNRRYQYAAYDKIIAKIRPILAKHEFVWNSQPTLDESGRFVLVYSLLHMESGKGVQGKYPLTEGPAQQQGSQISYAKRYALVAVLDLEVVGEDDDAMERQHVKIPGPDHERLIPRQEPGDRPAERTRVVDNPGDNPWDNQPPGEYEPTPPEDHPGSVNSRTLKRLQIEFRRHGIEDRDVRLGMVTEWIGREILTANQLSEAEALHVIKKIGEAGDD